MMTNPYRAYSETVSCTPSPGCVVCRTRAALAHVNWLRIAVWVVAGTLPMVSVASAALTCASVTMNARMLTAAEALDAATARMARTPKTPPVPIDPLYPTPSSAMSVCTSVEREVYRDALFGALSESRPPGPRIVPEASNGKTVGLRLFGIREGSGLSRLGLVDGDLVLSVNGSEIRNPEKALGLYERVRTADEIILELSRNGLPRELRFHVLPGEPRDPQRERHEPKSTGGSKPLARAVSF
jgi:hypothetical protein